MNQRFAQQDVRIARMGAMSAALTQAATVAGGLSRDNRLSVGVGAMAGQRAYALNYQRALSGGKIALNLGVSVSGNERTYGCSGGYRW